MKRLLIGFIVVLLLLMVVPCFADLGPPGELSLEECVLAVPGLLNPQSAITGNEFVLMTVGLDQTIITIEYDRSKLINDPLYICLMGAKVVRLSKADRSNLGRSPMSYDKSNNNHESVNLEHFDFG